MKRRSWLFAGIGALAAAGGVAWQLRRAADDATPAALWEQRFLRPEGGELVLAELRGRPLLINFWATWCPPCIKELPDLDRFWRSHAQQLAVIGLAIDGLEPVRAFLQKTPVGFGIGLAGLSGTELSRSLGNHAGALPFTVLLDASGKTVQRKLGETTLVELENWARAL